MSCEKCKNAASGFCPDCLETVTNYPKTWQDKFDELDSICLVCKSGLKQFISELRKHDEEELIKLIEIRKQDLTNLTENNDIWKRLGDDARLFNSVLEICKQLIKDYYAK